MLTMLAALVGIIIMDLAFSADNSIALGAAASRLVGKQRTVALLVGGAMALVLRVAFASVVTVALQIPWLGVIGGVALLYVAFKLVRDARKSGEKNHKSAATMWGAIGTIVLADVTMALDNVLGIAALADGTVWLVVAGLVISMALVLAGSALVSKLLHRFPWAIYIASAVLAFTAIRMMVESPWGEQVVAYTVALF